MTSRGQGWILSRTDGRPHSNFGVGCAPASGLLRRRGTAVSVVPQRLTELALGSQERTQQVLSLQQTTFSSAPNLLWAL